MVEHYLSNRTVEIPENVEITVHEGFIAVKGPLGESSRRFPQTTMQVEKVNHTLNISSSNARKDEVAALGAIASHVQNMIKGVTKGFTYRMKIVYAHFPVTVKPSPEKVVIENFQGEKTPRKARVRGKVEISIDGDDIIIKGTELESVAQTAANIEQATRIRKKDSRVFLDGIYTFAKEEGM
jgi:large subunit ribosomal protein L6